MCLVSLFSFICLWVLRVGSSFWRSVPPFIYCLHSSRMTRLFSLFGWVSGIFVVLLSAVWLYFCWVRIGTEPILSQVVLSRRLVFWISYRNVPWCPSVHSELYAVGGHPISIPNWFVADLPVGAAVHDSRFTSLYTGCPRCVSSSIIWRWPPFTGNLRCMFICCFLALWLPISYCLGKVYYSSL